MSIWTDTSILPGFAPLKEDLTVDVLIIGGGITGVLCAYMLEREEISYALAEADVIGGGITKNTTAKITAQHGLIYADLLDRFGSERTRMYLEANQDALQKYRELCGQMDCDFTEQNAYVYALDRREKLEREMDALHKIGALAEFKEELLLPFPSAGAVCFPDQAEFHPLKFLASIAKDLRIYEHTRIKELAPHVAVTDSGKIRAEKMVVTTHFPMLNKHGSYFLKLYQDRSYVIAIKDAQDVEGMYIDETKKGLSFRNYQDLLLIGGGNHRTGKRGGGWEELEAFAKRYYPGASQVDRWATQDCMTLDGVPYIGQYSKRTPELLVAAGYNKWGMTSSMAAAGILTDMILERENPWAQVFSPSRSILRPQLLVNAGEAAANLLTLSRPRCPHMGCALHWNEREHTWDCGCHGSRFEENGKLIDNPATGDL